MTNMLNTIAGGAAALMAALLAYASTRPGTFLVQRTVTIRASPDEVFPLINDFRQWTSWSPFEKLDPSMTKSYSGAPAGKGAIYHWSGNRRAGEGRMEITGASPPDKVKIKLDFLKPFEGHNTAEFSLVAAGGATNVTWAMYGPQSYMAKVISVFCSMDKMLGKEFEAGLANLQSVAERTAVIIDP